MPPTPLIFVPCTPQIPDALPLYSRRDPEAASIHSTAPSYISEAPTYHTVRPTPIHSQSTPNALPAFAPGFRRPYTNMSPSDLSAYNINEWSSARSGLQAKHYHNVALRRAQSIATEDEDKQIVNLARSLTLAIAEGVSSSSPQAYSSLFTDTPDAPRPLAAGPSTTPSSPSSASSPTTTTTTATPTTPTSPSTRTIDFAAPHEPYVAHEDPALVGQVAAREARDRRLYLENHAKEQAALNQEGKTWDFLLVQMADWGERERSWEGFRRDSGKRRGVLGGRRWGLGRGVGI